jgi:hypothetical protein
LFQIANASRTNPPVRSPAACNPWILSCTMLRGPDRRHGRGPSRW